VILGLGIGMCSAEDVLVNL